MMRDGWKRTLDSRCLNHFVRVRTCLLEIWGMSLPNAARTSDAQPLFGFQCDRTINTVSLHPTSAQTRYLYNLNKIVIVTLRKPLSF